MRTAEPLAGVTLAHPQDVSAKCQSAPCWKKEHGERHGCVAIVSTYLSLQNAVTEIFLNGKTSISLVPKNLVGVSAF